MPLPNDPTAPWPPPALKPLLADMAEADAWFSGDIDRLRNQYAKTDPLMPRAQGEPQRPGPLGRVKFWTRRGTDKATARQQLHVPIAADISSTSADLLFGEDPTWTIPGATAVTESGRPSDPAARETQVRLDWLLSQSGMTNTLLEAAEVSSALGGVWLRAVWDDTDRLPYPTVAVVHADAAVPEWRWGRLQAVTFWTTLGTEAQSGDKPGKVWRHLERHEADRIEHGLYLGTRDKLGRRQPLTARPETVGLLEGDDRTYDDSDHVLTIPNPDGVDGMTVRYLPNVRPNRRHRGSMHGRSDYDGTFPLMDALDETFTSWMRDVRLGVGRIIASQDALSGAGFDPDQEVFIGLDVEPTERTGSMIDQVQFDIRVEQHEQTALSLIERITSTAGYAPQSFGLHIDGRAEAGTALRVREAKTLRTRGRKERYAIPVLQDLGLLLLQIDAAVYGSGVTPMRPAVALGDALVDDPQEIATTIELLDRARAASTRTRVKMAQPELEGAELDAEVERVQAESGAQVGDPTGGFDLP